MSDGKFSDELPGAVCQHTPASRDRLFKICDELGLALFINDEATDADIEHLIEFYKRIKVEHPAPIPAATGTYGQRMKK